MPSSRNRVFESPRFPENDQAQHAHFQSFIRSGIPIVEQQESGIFVGTRLAVYLNCFAVCESIAFQILAAGGKA